MVRAILEGRKTQTRRIIKSQPKPGWNQLGGAQFCAGEHPKHHDCSEHAFELKCPYGQPGNRLWVRETWARVLDAIESEGPVVKSHLEYRADCPDAKYPGDWPEDEAKGNDDAPKWRPSIHMPRYVSRILLEIVSVRVERLHDMRLPDYEAEGYLTEPVSVEVAVERWRDLWDGLNGKGAHEANPWVWCIEFRRVG